MLQVSNILGKGPSDARLEDAYKVDKQIGKGAFGVVRTATKRSNGDVLAVKSISKAKLVCKEDVKDVQAEVAIMNLVAGHPYVVTLKVRTPAAPAAEPGQGVLHPAGGGSGRGGKGRGAGNRSNCAPGPLQGSAQPCVWSWGADGACLVVVHATCHAQSTHEDKEHVHIVMELCAGGELFDSIVEAGSFTEKKAALIFRKMVEVVNHCHELGVMHRDLKPGARPLGTLCRVASRIVPPCRHCPDQQHPPEIACVG